MKSEFLASMDLILHEKDGEPCPNIAGSKEILVKKGEAIPANFIPGFLRNNRDFIANLKSNNGIPELSEEQEKKYGLKFVAPPPQDFKDIVDKEYQKYDEEKLKQKLAYCIKKYGTKEGHSKFKEWCEKEFGESVIDKRKSSDNIIIDILNKQDGVA